MTHVLGTAIIQTFSIKKGLQVFGERGKEAVCSELQQMQGMTVYTPMDASKLTPEQRKHVLVSLIFLVEKQNGIIKASNVADGSKQRTMPG